MLNIFLTNLGKYNEGELLGEWVSLPVTEDELNAVFDTIQICHGETVYADCFGNPYEEYFITDYETDFGIEIHEYANLDDLNELAETLEYLSNYDEDIVKALLSDGFDLEEALKKKDDCMVYWQCENMEDVARQYAEETGLLNEVPESLRDYFDFEAYGRDMEGRFIFTENGNCIQVFN